MDILKIKIFARQKMPGLIGKKQWDELDLHTQEILINNFVDVAKDEIGNVEKAFAKVNERNEQFTMLLSGIMLGLGVGLLANAVTNSVGANWAVWTTGGILLIVGVCWTVITIRKRNHLTLTSNNLLAKLDVESMQKEKENNK